MRAISRDLRSKNVSGELNKTKKAKKFSFFTFFPLASVIEHFVQLMCKQSDMFTVLKTSVSQQMGHSQLLGLGALFGGPPSFYHFV